MGAQVPLVMALDDPGAVPGVAGGKGASLARLARAGFRVPPGFHVTTSAYLDFIGRGGLREPVLAAMSAVEVSDAATFGAAAARIGELFAGQPVPAPAAAAIAGAYACLGDDVPVAVRSSATVEDLPGMSAAGQHDTYLNVRGEAAVLERGQAVLGIAMVGAGHRLPRSPWRRAWRGEHRRRRAAARARGGGRCHVHHRPGRRRPQQGRDQRELGPRRVRRRRRRHPRRRGRRPGVGDARQLPGGQQGDDDRGRRHGHPGDRHPGRPAFGGGALAGPGGRAGPGRPGDRKAV